MEAALRALNSLIADKTVTQYAIGGAIAASFYITATQTEDIDAFVFLAPSASGLLSLSPIYKALVDLGGTVENKYVRFGDWPLQILPDANDLIAEAIRDAQETEYNGIPTRVFSAEHVCAVALQTGRAKDLLRVSMFVEQAAVSLEALALLNKRFELEGRMQRVNALIQGNQ